MPLFDEILIPPRNYNHQIASAVGDALTTQPRFGRQFPGGVEHVFLVVGGRDAGVQTFFDVYVAGSTGTNAAARVIDFDARPISDIEDAAG